MTAGLDAPSCTSEMDYTLALNGLDELKERLAAEMREQWREVCRSAEHLPGRLKQKLRDAVDAGLANASCPETVGGGETARVWEAFKAQAGIALFEAAKDETEAFQRDVNRAHAATVERLYGFAVAADRVSQHVMTVDGLTPDSMSLVDLLSQYRQARQDGGPSLDNTYFYAGLYAGAFGFQDIFEKFYASAPPALGAPVAGADLRETFLRLARTLLDEHFALVRDAAVATCAKALSKQFHEFAYYPEAYLSRLSALCELARNMRAGQAERPAGMDVPTLVRPSHPICPHCRVENHSEEELIFCSGCGRAFKRSEAEGAAPPPRCLNCGTIASAGNVFCGNCGQRVG